MNLASPVAMGTPLQDRAVAAATVMTMVTRVAASATSPQESVSVRITRKGRTVNDANLNSTVTLGMADDVITSVSLEVC